MGRLERWQEVKRYLPVLVFDDDLPDDDPVLTRYREASAERPSQGTIVPLVRQSKEIILEVRDGADQLHFALIALDPGTMEFVVGAAMEMFDFDSDEEIKAVMALAISEDVPVYPEDDVAAARLASLHRDLVANGFKVSKDGPRFKVTRAGKVLDADYTLQADPHESVTPAELIVARDALKARLAELEHAQMVLSGLDLAIEELSQVLQGQDFAEARLQDCLLRHPVLFGVEYTRLIPKHALGDDMEMDYALERVSGLFDLVELERSTHHLFTRSGQPRTQLVHAEQQVLDWLRWIEKHHEYAREKLPGIQRPVGFIVIGRSHSLTPGEKERLVQRNIMFRGTLEVLTYDDLLGRAENLRDVLKRAHQNA